MKAILALLLVALLVVCAQSKRAPGSSGPTKRFPTGFNWKNKWAGLKRKAIAAPVEADEEDDEESDFWMALAPLAINLIKNKLSKRDAADEDDEEADAEFFKNLLKKVGGIALQAGKAYVGSKYGIQLDEEEEEADFINWKKIGEVAKNVGKSYLSSKYGINLDEEDDEEADAEFLGKLGEWWKNKGQNLFQKGLQIYSAIKGNKAAPAAEAPAEGDAIESDSEVGALTVAQLQAIMPTLSSSKANEMIGYLNSALNEFSINTCSRRSAFLAQLAHESGQLRWFEEFASGAAYEGRKDLGNTHPGDGKRYKGRGPIQLTGRANYRSAGQALHLDLEGNPTQAATPQVGFRIAGWFWSTRSLNSLADQHSQASFDQITRRINGGTNGKADRDHFYAKAKQVLGC